MNNTIKLGNFISEYSVRNRAGDDIPVYSVTNKEGFCRDYFSKDVASQDRSTYKIVPRGCFAYNPSRINVGSVDWQRKEDRVIVSPLYVVFSVSKGLDQQYLYYYLKSEKCLYYIKELASGSVRDNLKLSMLKEFTIPNITLEEQRKAVMVLEQTDRLIALQERQMTVLDELVKSRFVEMFGLPGTDVHGWGMSSLGEICEINPKKSQDARLTNGLLVSFVPMPSVSESGDIDATQVKPYDEVKTGFTYFAENDVLFAKITPCMENGKGAIATGLYNGIGFGSTEFHVLRPAKETATPRWIYTLTVFPQFRIDAASNMTGSAGQRRVPASFLENYRVSVPPLELQNRFAAFVTEVDKSKLAVKQSLEKLETLKKSLMQQYFG